MYDECRTEFGYEALAASGIKLLISDPFPEATWDPSLWN